MVRDPASFLDHLLRARAQRQSLGPIDELSSHLSGHSRIVALFFSTKERPHSEIKENAFVAMCDHVEAVSASSDVEWLSLRRR